MTGPLRKPPPPFFFFGVNGLGSGEKYKHSRYILFRITKTKIFFNFYVYYYFFILIIAVMVIIPGFIIILFFSSFFESEYIHAWRWHVFAGG